MTVLDCRDEPPSECFFRSFGRAMNLFFVIYDERRFIHVRLNERCRAALLRGDIAGFMV